MGISAFCPPRFGRRPLLWFKDPAAAREFNPFVCHDFENGVPHRVGTSASPFAPAPFVIRSLTQHFMSVGIELLDGRQDYRVDDLEVEEFHRLLRLRG